MHKLIEYVCDELKELETKAEKGGLSASEIEYADTLAHLKKNLLKGEMLYDEFDGEEYSGAGRRVYHDGSYRGDSYRGRSMKRDAMGRYSRERDYSRTGDMVEQLRDMMDDAPDEQTRTEIKRLINKMEMK